MANSISENMEIKEKCRVASNSMYNNTISFTARAFGFYQGALMPSGFPYSFLWRLPVNTDLVMLHLLTSKANINGSTIPVKVKVKAL